MLAFSKLYFSWVFAVFPIGPNTYEFNEGKHDHDVEICPV